MITKKDVEHLAKLSRLDLKEEEMENLKKDLNKILDYIAELNRAEVSDIAEYFKSAFTENEIRKDEVEIDYKGKKSEMLGKILKEAPKLTNSGFFEIPPILDKSC